MEHLMVSCMKCGSTDVVVWAFAEMKLKDDNSGYELVSFNPFKKDTSYGEPTISGEYKGFCYSCNHKRYIKEEHKVEHLVRKIKSNESQPTD